MTILAKITNTIIFHTGSLMGFFFRENYLRKAAKGRKNSEKLLLNIVRKDKDIEYGKKFGFSQIHSVDDFEVLLCIFSTH